jgi:hypothetical protein
VIDPLVDNDIPPPDLGYANRLDVQAIT